VLFAASVVGFCIALTDLLEVGTCASGNTPYVIAQPCPEGTGSSVLVLVLSIFGLLASGLAYALRGAPGGGGGLPFVLGWAIFFTATGAASLIHTLTSDTIPVDGKLGGQIVGVIFLLMGVPALVFSVWRLIAGGRDRAHGPTASGSPARVDLNSLRGLTGLAEQLRQARAAAAEAAPGESASDEDTISQLERLGRLRDDGTLTQAEFEAQKRRVLGK